MLSASKALREQNGNISGLAQLLHVRSGHERQRPHNIGMVIAMVTVLRTLASNAETTPRVHAKPCFNPAGELVKC
jgi:hypothetical protein